MSRWANWSSGTQTKMSLSSFMLQEEKGRPVPGEPEEIARQNGWTGKEYGWYVDNSGTVVGRAIQGQMYVYDTDPRAEGQVDNGNPTSAASGQTPGDKARAMGLQSNGKGSYIDPQTGQVAARTVNNELVFYDQRPGGGAVSDGAGGRALTQSAPSWQDPVTGMIIVPPAQPEDPQEQASVPDPVPAQAPDGFSAYMMKVKIDTYEKEKREREIEGEINQKTQQMQGFAPLNTEYQKLEQVLQQIDANLQSGQIDQARAQQLTVPVNEHKQRLELAADRVTQDTEGMDPEYVEQAATLQASIVANERELSLIEQERKDMQSGKDYQTAGPELQQVMDNEFDESVAADVEEINNEVNMYGNQYQSNLERGTEAKELQQLKEVALDPNYDLNQEGKTVGSGKFGTVTTPGDGNVIKTGKIDRKEAMIMAKLTGTGVAPRLVNYSPAGPSQDTDKLAMTLVQGKPLALENLSTSERAQAVESYIKKLGRMHSQGISHGDLHAGNIIFDKRTGDASLVDFGFAEDGKWWKAFLEAANVVNDNSLGSLERLGQGSENPASERLKSNYLKAEGFIIDETQRQGFDDIDFTAFGDKSIHDVYDKFEDIADEERELMGESDMANMGSDILETGINKIPDEIYQQALKMLYDGFE